jgi:hypothetical protein
MPANSCLMAAGWSPEGSNAETTRKGFSGARGSGFSGMKVTGALRAKAWDMGNYMRLRPPTARGGERAGMGD